jgi:hypothetical protein
MTAYSYNFSQRVVSDFLKRRTRGWSFLQKQFPTLTERRIVWIFAHDQKRWYAFKRTLKLVDRLSASPYYSDSDVIKNLFSQQQYFANRAELEYDRKRRL